MTLRHIYLGLEGSDLEKYKSDFLFRTHFMTNWIQKQIRKQKIETPNFNLLFIAGATNPPARSNFAHENSWNCPINFNLQEYLDCKNESEYIELFCRMLTDGINKTENDTSLDLTVVKQALANFSRNGFQNKWKHKSKKLEHTGLTAELFGELDINEFRLILSIRNSKNVLMEKVIKTTQPSILIFRNYLKEIILKDQELIIQDRFGNSMFESSLSDIEKLCLTPHKK